MKVLIFGTTYINTAEKRDLADKWWRLHGAINPLCDKMFVDSASPLLPSAPVNVLQLGDNIGHLSRGGQDGWGRAFCAGLQHAIDYGYDYVAHIEGDSLCRLDVAEQCASMAPTTALLTVPVIGTRLPENNWIETGMMIMSVPLVAKLDIVGRYDWRDCEPKRKYPVTPERWLFRHFYGHTKFISAMTLRDDMGLLSRENVRSFDWISHTAPEVYDEFFRINMPRVLA